jgi:hypothetical protein
MIEAQLMQQRIETTQRGQDIASSDRRYAEQGRGERFEEGRTSREDIAEKNREQRGEQFAKREQRLGEGLDVRKAQLAERVREFDTRTRQVIEAAQAKAEAARQKAVQAQQTRDDKQHAAAIAEWDKSQRAYDSYMRNAIAAATNLAGPEKTKMLQELDAEFKRFLQEKEAIQKQSGGSTFGERFNAAGGAPVPPGGAPVPPGAANDPDGTTYRRDGKTYIKQGNQLVPQ